MTTLKEYEARAEAWGLQTSTIGGIAAITMAVTGGGLDAATGMPVVSAAIGLLIGGIFAILLPGRDATPVIAGAEEIVSAIESHKTDLAKATESAQVAASTVDVAVPKLAAAAEAVTEQVAGLAPVVQAVAAATDKPGVAAVVGDAGQVLDAVKEGLAGH